MIIPPITTFIRYLISGKTIFNNLIIRNKIKSEELELIQKITEKIVEEENIEETFKEVIQGIKKMVGGETGVIFLLNEKGDEIEELYHPVGDRHFKPRLGKGLTSWVFNNNKPIFMEDIRSNPQVTNEVTVSKELADTYISLAALPLCYSKKVVGVLFINFIEKHKFDVLEKKMLTRIINLISVLIVIKRKEDLQQSIIDNIPYSLFRKDLNSKFVAVNEKFLKDINEIQIEGRRGAITRRNIIGHSDADFFKPEIGIGYMNKDAEIIRNKIQETIEEQFPNKSGQMVWVKTTKTPILKNINGFEKVIGLQGIFTKLSEELSETLFRDLINQSPDAIILHKKGVVVMCNPAAIGLFSVKDGSYLIGTSIMDRISERYRAVAHKRMETLWNKGNVNQGEEMEIIQFNGNIKLVEVYSKSMKGDNEVQAVFRDLTIRKTLIDEIYHRVTGCLEEIVYDFESGKRMDMNISMDEYLSNKIKVICELNRMMYNFNPSYTKDNLLFYFDTVREKLQSIYGLPIYNISITINCSCNPELYDDKIRICCIIIYELVRNSIKHSFMEKKGKILINILEEPDLIRVEYLDYSRKEVVQKHSSGLQLIDTLVKYSLKGEFDDNGKAYSFTVPLKDGN